jgi:hypothetical protein
MEPERIETVQIVDSITAITMPERWRVPGGTGWKVPIFSDGLKIRLYFKCLNFNWAWWERGSRRGSQPKNVHFFVHCLGYKTLRSNSPASAHFWFASPARFT